MFDKKRFERIGLPEVYDVDLSKEKEPVWGYYWDDDVWPEDAEKYKGRDVIELHEDLEGKKRLNTLVHELFHHLFPYLGHRWIYRFASIFTRILWADGWRRIGKRRR